MATCNPPGGRVVGLSGVEEDFREADEADPASARERAGSRIKEQRKAEAEAQVVTTRCPDCGWFRVSPMLEGHEAYIAHRARGCGRLSQNRRATPGRRRRSV
jgi:hypothetical protein